MLTPEIHQRVVAYITGGAFDYVAAQAAGISQRTFYNWLSRGERGEPGDEAYVQFMRDVQQRGDSGGAGEGAPGEAA